MLEVSKMSSEVLLREASDLLRLIAMPVSAGETVQACQRRVHRRLRSWSFNRIRDVWRPDPRVRIQAHEVEQLRAIAARRRLDADTRAELRAIKSQIERLERLLQATDPDMHSPTLAALRHQRGEAVRALGARDRPDPA